MHVYLCICISRSLYLHLRNTVWRLRAAESLALTAAEAQRPLQLRLHLLRLCIRSSAALVGLVTCIRSMYLARLVGAYSR